MMIVLTTSKDIALITILFTETTIVNHLHHQNKTLTNILPPNQNHRHRRHLTIHLHLQIYLLVIWICQVRLLLQTLLMLMENQAPRLVTDLKTTQTLIPDLILFPDLKR